MDTVADILKHKGQGVVSVGPTETVLEAARRMNEQGIGGVVVLEGDQIVGIFTERDILRRVVAEKRDPAATEVKDVMTTPVTRCRAKATLEECIAVMTDKRIRHLPVIDDDGIAGIITSGDVLAHQVREQEFQIEHLNKYIFDMR